MTKRKPLQWYDTEFGPLPGAVGHIFAPGFAEACESVAIEHPTSAADLARRVLDHYHAQRHPVGMLGGGQ